MAQIKISVVDFVFYLFLFEIIPSISLCIYEKGEIWKLNGFNLKEKLGQAYLGKTHYGKNWPREFISRHFAVIYGFYARFLLTSPFRFG